MRVSKWIPVAPAHSWFNTIKRVSAHNKPVCRLPEVWPSEGAIDVQSLVVRYRPELDPVLKGISFSVKGAVQRLSQLLPCCTVKCILVLSLSGW